MPIKNRYIIVYNEVNRGDEWGGTVNPQEYAHILSFSVSVFKSKSQDFFIICSGMDNAAPNQYPAYMNEYNFFQAMREVVPTIFDQIDGLASHSYPNPGFAQPPYIQTSKSITSYKYEKDLVERYRSKPIPVFITETGWNAPGISESTKAAYLLEALQSIWNEADIIAITPFLLNAGEGPFKGFSFMRPDGAETEQYKAVIQLKKTEGKPILPQFILGSQKDIVMDYPKKKLFKSIF